MRRQLPAQATALTHPTTDQGPQQVIMRVVVAARPRLILGQLGLYSGKLLGADQGPESSQWAPSLPAGPAGAGVGWPSGWVAERRTRGARDRVRPAYTWPV